MLSEQLVSVRMPVVSQSQCVWSKPEFFGRVTSDATFCAGFRNGDNFFYILLNIQFKNNF